MTRHTKKVLSALALTSVLTAAVAAPYVSLQSGFSSLKLGKTQDVNIGNGFENKYLSGGRAHPMVLDLELGFTGTWQKQYPWQLGFEVGTQSDAKQSGKVYVNKLSSNYDYDYSYKYGNTHLMLNGQMGYPINKHITPYIKAGVGLVQNDMSNYVETPIDSENDSVYRFPSRSTTQFAYQVGVGVSWPFYKHVSGHIGYLYQHFGKANLAPASGATSKFTTSTLDQHSFVYGVSFVF